MSYVAEAVEPISLTKESINRELQIALTAIYNKKETERLELLENFEQRTVENFIRKRTKAADENNFREAKKWNQFAKLARRRYIEFFNKLALHRWRVRFRLEEFNGRPHFQKFSVRVLHPTGRVNSRVISD